MHRWINLSLLILFPLSWFAPLMRAGLLPLFGLREISVFTGIGSLLEESAFLGLIVLLFAVIFPYAKTVGLALIHVGKMSDRYSSAFAVLGKLAMADIFLIAIYISIAREIPIGSIELAWGLYLFTACILASLWVSWRTEQLRKLDQTDPKAETIP